MHYAIQAFALAREAADYISANKLKYGTPLYYPLFTSIGTNYARPFKSSNLVGKLPPGMVPAGLRDIHIALLILRDQLFAHSDGDGPQDEEGRLYEVRYRWVNKRLLSVRFEPKGDRIDFSKVSQLCTLLINKAEYHLARLERKHQTLIPRSRGDHVLNIDPAVDAVFISAP